MSYISRLSGIFSQSSFSIYSLLCVKKSMVPDAMMSYSLGTGLIGVI